jgi:nucleotide-binding universal stress UspA family protein
MNTTRILVPFDFTDTTFNAAKFASLAAQKGNMAVTLLHVTPRQAAGDIQVKLGDYAKTLSLDGGIECNYLTRQGDLFEQIAAEACDECYRFLVIGSHGFKGLREKFMGSDILKLAKVLPIPAIIIQKDFHVTAEGIRRIVFPAGTHKAFSQNVEATILIAKLFDAEIRLYTVEKKGQKWSDDLVRNIDMARSEFEKHQIRFERVNEPQTTFSLGYSKQILQYARDHKADLIAVMAIPTPEHYYFADSDKEMLLTNEFGIPVLSTSDRKQV